jgi:hypothetical protein
MFRRLVLAVAIATLAGCGPKAGGGQAVAEQAGAAAAEIAGGAPAGAPDAITAWAVERYGAQIMQPVQAFYGDFTGDGASDALAWVLYMSGGNSLFLDVALFRNEGGAMRYYRSAANVFGGDPRNVVFALGRVTLTSTMPRPGDPRCCPTGSQDWIIDTK